MRLLLDTSCLVSFFLMDAHYTKARGMLEKIAQGEIEGIISALSLAELCGVVRRNTDEGTAKEVQGRVKSLIGRGLIEVRPLKVSDAHEAGDIAILAALKGADAVIVQAARESGARLFTFDKEMKERAAGLVGFFEG